MYCRRCQYLLRELTQSVCPECGQSFDPDDPKTFSWSPVNPRRQRIRSIWIAAVMGVAVVVIGIFSGWFFQFLPNHTIVLGLWLTGRQIVFLPGTVVLDSIPSAYDWPDLVIYTVGFTSCIVFWSLVSWPAVAGWMMWRRRRLEAKAMAEGSR